MSVDVDFLPHLLMKDSVLTTQYDRRNSWATSISSSSSSSANATSWLERKLFSHFKRFFRRKSLSLTSNSSLSSRRPSSTTTDDIISLPVDEQPHEEEEEEEEDEDEEQKEEKEKPIIINNEILPVRSPPTTPVLKPIDLLYDYDRLLARCSEQRERDQTEMLLRCRIPISIPHADLVAGQSRTIVVNWKSYIRLFNGLKRDAHLFQEYINQHYSCQSFINSREQLTLNIRTTKTTFDNVLRKFLDEYVTCLICQTAQTHLIKSDGIWRIECQLCGTQRIVKRLRWKHQHHHHQYQ
ncbi:unnamed protein product [Rotaria socialis]|uniref:Eukaryotic translation initiation factor 2 subunit 2 n=1 Tax=Rotaria socialis TaxID=392032 RepID=A0A821Y992_9BILA|nr:unnamed protein product [Rotaria socialis]CAF3446527.1 unnamed protein product [Rotaria socialis]CAF3475182.1 unnamed protein product [Rotaria socialis]CAF3722876.1 unnamed protein product [Rotaria socialis]CAF4152220.1 unnamed protein product [Rotaria socialis]